MTFSAPGAPDLASTFIASTLSPGRPPTCNGLSLRSTFLSNSRKFTTPSLFGRIAAPKVPRLAEMLAWASVLSSEPAAGS